MNSLPLPFEEAPDSLESRIDARDRAGRERAVDPRFNVALEASAGTGKTRVLVDRYVNLLRAGVDPLNVLAMTFTRKAAAEMRERIVASLRAAAERGDISRARWRELRDRTGDIAISTIDAFCLSLLREFPLEAGLDPGFTMADDTDVPRLVDESLDRAVRICRSLAREDEHVGLVFAQLGDRRTRAGLSALLNRRLVAPAVLDRYLTAGPRDVTVPATAVRGGRALIEVFETMRGGLDRFLETGPLEPAFQVLQVRLGRLQQAVARDADAIDPALVQAAYVAVREHFLTHDGEPRARLTYSKGQFFSPADWQTHRDLVVRHAPAVRTAYQTFRRELNVLVSRGVRRMLAIAETEYQRTLRTHAVLDFPEVLLRTLDLLRQMEEFAQSRYRLESRYHHVLVDEFQDTSRAQWELVSLLVQSWGEGAGLTHSGPLPPSIFIVGDRKQSIYGFRDADVSVLTEAGRYLGTLRPDGDVGRSISRSFRAVPAVLAFVNDVCHEMPKVDGRPDAFRFAEEDRFPITGAVPPATEDALGVVTGSTADECAGATASEIARLLQEGATIRDRDTGLRRAIRPGDIAILFRTRDSHRQFEDALEQRGIPAFVYKGLGFFDADEIKDMLALLAYLADPASDLRAAAWMRSRFVRISDEGLRTLAPGLADALRAVAAAPASQMLGPRDSAALTIARAAVSRWLPQVDRVPPAELLDTILRESAYVVTMRGARFVQARENLKKIRALVRRIQNRGYATLGRIATRLDRLAVGEEANAVVDARDAVNLMTVHASKGLEFPVVFVVNLSRGTGRRRDPIRVDTDPDGVNVSVSVGDFHSGADDDEEAREREETKRLTYVAFTRARDRLYLGALLQDGRVEPGRGSLAGVLPASLLETFAAAAAGAGTVVWQSQSAHRHRLRACAPEAPPLQNSERPEAIQAVPTLSPETDYDALTDAAVPRRSIAAVVESAVTVTRNSAPPDRLDQPGHIGDREAGRLVGTLVHRLVQHVGFGADLDDAQATAAAAHLLKTGEAFVAGPDLLMHAVVSFRMVSRNLELRELYQSGQAFHEVPFTLVEEEGIVRGTIDCLIDGGERMTVVELKTGQSHPEHAAQVEIYRRAVQAIFPDRIVETRLVYAGAVAG